MKPLSILIPNLGSASDFEATLASVLRTRPAESQIIVMTDDQYSDPYQIGDDVEWCVAGRARWIDQWNLAIEKIHHKWALVLAPGVLLDDDWHRFLNDSLAGNALAGSVAAVSPSLVSAFTGTPAVCNGVALKPDGSIRPVSTRKRASRQAKATSIDAPGIFAGVWRSSQLKSLAPWDNAWTFHDVGLDLAHAFRSRRLLTIASDQWSVHVEDPALILEAFIRPRGTVIERCLVRHQSRSRRHRFGNLAYRLASDLLACPSQPWRMAQAWQRLGAGKYRRDDLRFRQRLAADETDPPFAPEKAQKFSRAA